jgi:hypothetical protein
MFTVEEMGCTVQNAKQLKGAAADSADGMLDLGSPLVNTILLQGGKDKMGFLKWIHKNKYPELGPVQVWLRDQSCGILGDVFGAYWPRAGFPVHSELRLCEKRVPMTERPSLRKNGFHVSPRAKFDVSLASAFCYWWFLGFIFGQEEDSPFSRPAAGVLSQQALIYRGSNSNSGAKRTKSATLPFRKRHDPFYNPFVFCFRDYSFACTLNTGEPFAPAPESELLDVGGAFLDYLLSNSATPQQHSGCEA